MSMDKVKNFCNHSMILQEMGANLLTNGTLGINGILLESKILLKSKYFCTNAKYVLYYIVLQVGFFYFKSLI